MASDYLLVIDGIKGESQDSKYKESIEILSFSWGATNGGSSSSNMGGGTGKVAFNDLACTTGANKSSPLLMLACASGQHISKAVLYIRKSGGEQAEFYVITMSDVLVSSYQSGGSTSGGTIPVDQFTLNFAKISFEYAPQKSDGTLDAKVKSGWDLKANKKL